LRTIQTPQGGAWAAVGVTIQSTAERVKTVRNGTAADWTKR
jgi:hypothetical protein